MKYFLESRMDGATKEITFEQAKSLLKGDYTERFCTYDEMLAYEGRIPLMFNILIAKE